MTHAMHLHVFPTSIVTIINLTHFLPETRKRVIGKQHRPRSDATSCGI